MIPNEFSLGLGVDASDAPAVVVGRAIDSLTGVQAAQVAARLVLLSEGMPGGGEAGFQAALTELKTE